MGIIRVSGITVYAYHGCLEEESLIGSEYRVDVSLHCDFSSAAASDKLDETIDYVRVHEIVREQMAVRSKLLEHVGRRIIEATKAEFNMLKQVTVQVAKINPPINGMAREVSIEITG
ncbi:MAG: dihydroneopterin aldolase [Cryomorphaceae bacterium]|nr:MAG: dihydroneopterin aldolase [Cryomorphaceae bacterium]